MHAAIQIVNIERYRCIVICIVDTFPDADRCGARHGYERQSGRGFDAFMDTRSRTDRIPAGGRPSSRAELGNPSKVTTPWVWRTLPTADRLSASMGLPARSSACWHLGMRHPALARMTACPTSLDPSTCTVTRMRRSSMASILINRSGVHRPRSALRTREKSAAVKPVRLAALRTESSRSSSTAMMRAASNACGLFQIRKRVVEIAEYVSR